MAKMRHADRANRAQVNRALGELGLSVSHEFHLVPGLMVFDTAGNDKGIPKLNSRSYLEAGDTENKADLEQQIEALKNSELFVYVEPDYVYRLTRDSAASNYSDGTLWGLRNLGVDTSGNPLGIADADIDADQAWDVTVGSSDVLIGVIDSGIWYTHQALASQMWQNPGEVPNNGIDDDENGWIDDVFGINSVVETGDPLDDNGHGTHVAAIAGGADGPEVVGVAWNVSLMALKAFDSSGATSGSDTVQAIEYGVDNGCHILNGSYGGPSFSLSALDAIKAARDLNVLFVAASGNEGTDNDIFGHYPSGYNLDNIISVGAMDRYDQFAFFSNYGLNSVDIVAPGDQIYSASNGADDAYAFQSGSSQATPYVAGVAALLLSAFPDLSYAETRERILSAAVKRPSYSGRSSTGGRLNAANVFDVVPDGFLEVTIDPPSQSALAADTTQDLVVRVADLFGLSDAVVELILPDLSVIPVRNDGEAPDVLGGDALYTGQLSLPSEPGELSLTIRVSAPGAETYESAVRYTVVTPPANDDFAFSQKLSPRGASLVTSNQFASSENGEPRHASVVDHDLSLWWTITPDQDGPFIVDTSGSSYDTVIGVYTGNELNRLNRVASVNNVGTQQAGYLFFDGRRGEGYRIAVAGADADEIGTLRLRVRPGGQPDTTAPVVTIASPLSGTINLENRIEVSGTAFDPSPNSSGVSQVVIRVNDESIGVVARGTTRWSANAFLRNGQNTITAEARDFSGNVSQVQDVKVSFFVRDPENDHFESPLALEGLEGEWQGTSASATKEFLEPLHGGNLGGRSLWFSYQPSEDGTLDLRTRRSGFDTLLGLYTGTKVTELTTIAGNDDLSAETTSGLSRILQAVRGGMTYWIALDGFGGQGGESMLSYRFVPGAVFDVQVSATEGGEVVQSTGLRTGGEEQTFTALADANFTFVRWQGSVDSTENPLTVLVDQGLQLDAVFAEVVVSDGFETGQLGSLNYRFDGDQPWSVTDQSAAVGTYSIRSGEIGDSSSSAMIVSGVFGGGIGSFDYSVSSEEGWDFLEFYVNDELRRSWSGEVSWQSFEFELPSGESVLEWRYSKDFANASGDDAAFVDNLDLPFGLPATGGATQLSVIKVGSQGLKLTIWGSPNTDYTIEASRDLITWEDFESGRSGVDGALRFGDEALPEVGYRFFRAAQR